MNDFIIGKYSVPIVPSAAIKRTRLISQMQSFSPRVILFVHSPIGYGKTTTTVQWLEAKNMKAAWLSLDEYDASVSDFYRGLLISFLNCNSDYGNTELVQSVLGDEGFDAFPLQRTLEALSRFNFNNGPGAVVIDDLHLFYDPTVALSLPVLRSRLPVHVRMVILSRNLPGDMLKDYMLKEMIKSFPFDDLQFTTDEVSKLFSKHGIRLSSYDAEKIQKQTMGWPVALNALILSKSDNRKAGLHLNSKNNNNSYLYSYIKNQINDFLNEETRSILLKTSICDFITPDLCKKLTGRQNAWDMLVKLSRKTGLVMKYGTESYRYQSLLRDFLLSELDEDTDIDKAALYRCAGMWHKEYGNIPAAIDMAAKCGDVSLLEDISRLHSYAYGRFNIGVESYTREVYSHVISKLPAKIIEQSPRLCLESWFATYAMGSYDESLRWMSAVKKHVGAGAITKPEDMFMAFFQFAADSEKDPWFIINFLKQMDFKANKLPSYDIPGQNAIPAFTLTYNMPFYHKAQRDYSEISPSLDEYIKLLVEYLPHVLSPYHELLALLTEGGIRYERYEIEKAKECARRAIELAQDSTPELMFASLMLLCGVYWAESNSSEPMKLWKKADAMIVESNAFYLSQNFNAFGTDLCLYNSDTDSARSWLEGNMPDEKPSLYLYNSFQNLVTAKALMVTGDFPKSLELLKGIREFSKVYRRTADYIEAGALAAVCLWRIRKYEEAAKTLTEAVAAAQKHELIMPVIKQGADVVPVLQRIMNQLKGGYIKESVDKAFVNTLFLGAHTIAGHYSGFFSNTAAEPIKLTQKQMILLNYLSQNLSQREMSELTDTKITTIKDHISKMYRKLGVNNAKDALLKAKEYGLL